jgi:hypothetical protein
VVTPEPVSPEEFTTTGAETSEKTASPTVQSDDESMEAPSLESVSVHSEDLPKNSDDEEESNIDEIKSWETIEPAIRTSSLDSLDSVMPWTPSQKSDVEADTSPDDDRTSEPKED